MGREALIMVCSACKDEIDPVLVEDVPGRLRGQSCFGYPSELQRGRLAIPTTQSLGCVDRSFRSHCSWAASSQPGVPPLPLTRHVLLSTTTCQAPRS